MNGQGPAPTEAEAMPHRLGDFRFANSLTFTVYGDDEHDPMAVSVMLDDRVQPSYQILAIEGVGCFYPPPETSWLEGWIDPRDPWARIIYGNTIGVIRQARSRGQRGTAS